MLVEYDLKPFLLNNMIDERPFSSVDVNYKEWKMVCKTIWNVSLK